MIGIYKITSPERKVYIGQSINLKRRFKEYKRGDCIDQIKLFRSLFKYGYINHQFEIIEECEFKDLNIKEYYWQKYYISVEEGLNCFYTNPEKDVYITTFDHKKNISLNNKNSKIVLDVLSGIFYNSLAEVSNTFNINDNTLRSKLAGFKKNNTQFEYIDLNKNGRGRAFEGFVRKQYLKVIDLSTGIIYNSIKHASKELDIPKSTLYYYLYNITPNKTSLQFYEE